MESINDFTVSLEKDPVFNYLMFKRQLQTIASNTMGELGEDGIYSTGICMTNVEWLQYCGGIVVPRPYPTHPEEIAAAARDGAVAKYNRERETFISFSKETKNLKAKICVALGKTISNSLEHPITGFRMVTIINILDHLHIYYGKITTATYASMINDLEQPFPAPSLSSFQNSTTVMSKIFTVMAINNCGLSEFHKIKYLIEATKNYNGMENVIQHFYVREAQPMNQTFTNLTNFISTHFDGFIKPYENFYANNVKASQTKQERSPSRHSRSLSTERSRSSVKKFCYVHGHGSHSGLECRIMANKTEINRRIGTRLTKKEIEMTGK
jgi:hypothetical protein